MKPSQDSLHFSTQDLQQIQQLGKTPEDVEAQLDRFAKGFPPITLVRPVSTEDGVLAIGESEKVAYRAAFEQAKQQCQMCKFVPASGASSRMFKTLFAYKDDPDQVSERQQKQMTTFFEQLPEFAFFNDLSAALDQAGLNLQELLAAQQYQTILTYLLTDRGLNYGQLPKALLPFHRYEGFVRTALEEHLVEGANYCASEEGRVHIHLTVSPQHISLMNAHLQAVVPHYEEKFQKQYQIDISTQNPATNTLATDLENRPFRDESGQLLFRPGGHGALLENLDEIDADFVFIKNIDNVVSDTWKAETYDWKQLIGGALFHYQQKIFDCLQRLDQSGYDDQQEQGIFDFMQNELGVDLAEGLGDWPRKKRQTWTRMKLNRPIRVCGVISTQEATGGGPFWVEEDKRLSVQIVETAQIDRANPQQEEILSRSRFAHITDLVCGLKDYQGKKFDLFQFRNDQTGFITQKSLRGKALKAMELPGLWNGAMADWNTLLVEVPRSTFNPVKTVMDLLESMHRLD